MFFLALLFFLLSAWLLPWWSFYLCGVFLGIVGPRRVWPMAGAAALSNMSIAFVMDGQSLGVISRRMSGVFSLPFSGGIFLVMGLIGAFTALAGYATAPAIVEFYQRISSRNQEFRE